MCIPVHQHAESIHGRKRSPAHRSVSMLATFVTLLFALLSLGGPQLQAQCGQRPRDRCQEADCRVDELLINTGYDHNAGMIYPDGAQDGFWTIIQDDDPSRPVPRPANVIKPAPGWGGPMGNTQWIGANPTADDDFIGQVKYEKCFCVCDDHTDLQFDMSILADDEASIYLDGVLMGGTPNPGYPNPTKLSFISNVTAGRHCIEVVVNNTKDPYAGVDIEGTIRGSGLLRYNCCPTPVTEQLNDCQITKLTLVTDDTWTMVSGPVGDSLNYPRCATIITSPHFAWAPPLGGTNWIGRDIFGHSQPVCISFSGAEHYLYRKSFCVDREGTFVITVTSMADDFGGNITLNGAPLGITGSYTTSTTQTFIAYLFPGCNCFEFDVEDKGCAVTGLDALINIQGGIMLRPECCDCGQCPAGQAQRGLHDGSALSGVWNDPAGALAPRPTLLSVPNPSTGETTIHYVIDKESDATVELFNTAGQRLMMVDQGMRKAGEHAIPVITKGLPAGAYRLQLKYGEKTLSIPLNIQ